MKIFVENLGAIKQAELEMGKFTIICGSNNTGKTYVTYALFGFLEYWYKMFSMPVEDMYIKTLLKQGYISINTNDLAQKAQEVLDHACSDYSLKLADVYSAQKKLFENSKFKILLEENDIKLKTEVFEQKIRPSSSDTDIFMLKKEENSSELIITLLLEDTNTKIPSFILKQIMGNALKNIIFGNLLPTPFIASAERTGATIFRKELDFARSRLIKELSKTDKKIDPFKLLIDTASGYASPVEFNVEFIRQLEALSKSNSFIAEKHIEILKDFSNIIGGEYRVNRNDELYFIPKNVNNVKLKMGESSSAVRSLLDIGFYLRHVAKKGDLLMIDEPELNLHPENQRKIARLFVRLLHVGVNVFITTHSDYIIKELNTMIMLNSSKPYILEIMKNEGYQKNELLGMDEIRVYIADKTNLTLTNNKRVKKCQTLIKADINQEQGIEAKSFDKIINDMNRIQDDIIFGGD